MKTSLRSFGSFIEAMIRKMEEVDPKYGDFRKYTMRSIHTHLLQEVEEWEKSVILPPEVEQGELVDIANLCYYLWAIIEETNK